MKVKDWLKKAQQRFNGANIVTSRLDALVLLADVFAADKSYVLAHLELSLTLAQQKVLDKQLAQRIKHFPLAYVRGKTEFYGREFKVSKDTLEPRPESETMIDTLKHLVKPDQKLTVADIGTGSGALAITAKLELPNLKVIASEISPTALKIARQNAKAYRVEVKFCEGDLIQPLEKYVNIVMANLPYVPDEFTINPAAMQEPKIAIFGGQDGLDLYRRLFEQVNNLKSKPQFILTESLPPQHKTMRKIATISGYKQTKKDDFIQLFKFTSRPEPR